jgi:ATP-dependent protease ClpP protease subunit
MSEKNQNTETILKIYGGIGTPVSDVFSSDFITAKQVSDFLDENKEAKNILVKINSNGGNVDDGFAIHDLLVDSGKNIETRVEGACYSIATIILLAGSKRTCHKNSDIIIHPPFIPPYSSTLAPGGNAEDLQKITDALKYEQDKIENFYIKKTKSKIEDLEPFMKSEAKITPDEAKKLGFITEILEPVKAVAFINKSNNNIMNNINNEVKETKSLIQKIMDKLNIKKEGVKNLDLKTADNTMLKIQTEGDTPKIGNVVVIEGKAVVDGEYLMPEGDKIVVEKGVISNIIPKENKTADEQMKADMENLKKENEELKKKVNENSGLQNEIKDLKDNITFINTFIESNYNPADRSFLKNPKVVENQNRLKDWKLKSTKKENN